MPGPGVDPGTGVRANPRRGVVTPPYELRLCAHRRGGIYAARGFAWAVVGGSVVGEGFIPPGMSTAAQASAGRRGRRPLQQSVGGMSTERRPVGAGHARPGGLTRGRASAQTRGGVWSPRPTNYVYVRIVGAAYMPPAGSRGQLSAGGHGMPPLPLYHIDKKQPAMV